MRTMAAAVWEALGNAANLAQISGLHALMLLAVGAALLHIPQSKRECVELERCTRRLRALLLQGPPWSTTGCAVAPLCSDIGSSVSKVLGDAAGLVDSYKKSTLWCLIRRGRSMARQLRDMKDINTYCELVLSINVHLLIVQATTTHQTSEDSTRIHEATDQPESPEAQALTNCPTDTARPCTERAHDIGQGGMGSQRCNTDAAECEGRMPDLVISLA